jgi:hypothetical protein
MINSWYRKIFILIHRYFKNYHDADCIFNKPPYCNIITSPQINSRYENGQFAVDSYDNLKIIVEGLIRSQHSRRIIAMIMILNRCGIGLPETCYADLMEYLTVDIFLVRL